jgi:hypothetical protein
VSTVYDERARPAACYMHGRLSPGWMAACMRWLWKFGGPELEDRIQIPEFHSAAEICKTETEQRLRSAYDSGRKSC